jgi:hypothetical protein
VACDRDLPPAKQLHAQHSPLTAALALVNLARGTPQGLIKKRCTRHSCARPVPSYASVLCLARTSAITGLAASADPGRSQSQSVRDLVAMDVAHRVQCVSPNRTARTACNCPPVAQSKSYSKNGAVLVVQQEWYATVCLCVSLDRTARTARRSPPVRPPLHS